MEKIERTEAPDWLKEKWRQWGEEWAVNCAKTKKGKTFPWRRNKNKGYEDLLKDLSDMTQSHCSYCDAYPMGCCIPSTIDHFKPKARFPLEAYKWENLFLCCGLCQQRNDDYNEHLLKPDDDSYSFDKYFDIDWVTGELKPNRDASPEDRERAKITIDYFRLNNNGKPDDRLAELDDFNDHKSPKIDEFSYRFFIKRGRLS